MVPAAQKIGLPVQLPFAPKRCWRRGGRKRAGARLGPKDRRILSGQKGHCGGLHGPNRAMLVCGIDGLARLGRLRDRCQRFVYRAGNEMGHALALMWDNVAVQDVFRCNCTDVALDAAGSNRPGVWLSTVSCRDARGIEHRALTLLSGSIQRQGIGLPGREPTSRLLRWRVIGRWRWWGRI